MFAVLLAMVTLPVDWQPVVKYDTGCPHYPMCAPSNEGYEPRVKIETNPGPRFFKVQSAHP